MATVLQRLIGEQLSEVAFVMDYVQLVFDGQRLTAWVWPYTEILGSGTRSEGQPGYRDSLCAFIASTVATVEESPEAGLALHFDIGVIRVLPKEADLVGPEIAMYQSHDDDHVWMVWGPGEPPFETLAP